MKIKLADIKSHTISDNRINTELSEMYRRELGVLAYDILQFNEKREQNLAKLSFPMLLSASGDYPEARHRIMVIAQDTNTWGDQLNQYGIFSLKDSVGTLVSDLMSLFDLHYNDYPRSTILLRFEHRIAERASQLGAAIIVNNLSKIGWACETQSDLTFNKKFVNMLISEIKICRTNAIIFLTGPSRDAFINETFGPFKSVPVFDNIETRKLARLKFNSGLLSGKQVLRTYHPKYLQIKHKQEPMMDAISDYITNLQFLVR